MSPERALLTKEILTNVSVEKIGPNYGIFRDRLADHYWRAWGQHGLCKSLEEAYRRLNAYERVGVFESSFIALTPKRDKIYAALLTRNLRAESILDFCEKVPKYRFFEFPIPGADKGSLKISVCFSITAEGGFRVKNEDMPEDVSLSEFLIFGYKTAPGAYKTAYSRLAGVGRRSVIKYYAKNVSLPRQIGATGMHETAYGGVTLAIIKGSRPEDAEGGCANTFVLLPKDETQREINAQILENRKRGFVPFEKIGPFILFLDTWPYLSLAR